MDEQPQAQTTSILITKNADGTFIVEDLSKEPTEGEAPEAGEAAKTIDEALEKARVILSGETESTMDDMFNSAGQDPMTKKPMPAPAPKQPMM